MYANINLYIEDYRSHSNLCMGALMITWQYSFVCI
uniref:Uncharacterized protein n=1 Tax=Arundo donax TaxID=35708 RepID=A0A0A9A5F3_ARUDO